MVKVVGRDESAVKRTTCYSCAAVLEYTQRGMKTFTSRDYTESTNTEYYITCPDCGSRVYVR